MKRFLLVFTTFCVGFGFFLMGCDDSDDDNLEIKPKNAPVVDNTISTDFTTNTFSSKVEEDLLREIHICDPNVKSEDSLLRPACSPKLFRFFKLNKSIPLKNGFILLAKAGVGGIPLRRVLIFQREQGVLVKVNGFVGNIIEKRNSKSGFDDIVIRFADNIENDHLAYYNCLFTWKNGKYEYVNCEVIDEGEPHRIKAEFMDSMAVEIQKILIKNQMIF